MRLVVAGLAFLALLSGCAPPAAPPATRAAAARLLLATYNTDRALTLSAVDPDTLADDLSVGVITLPRCSSVPIVAPDGAHAVSVVSPIGRCEDAPSATVSILDMRAWVWGKQTALPTSGPEPLALDLTDRWPVVWSPDSQAIYAITTTPSAQRALWRVDTNARSQPLARPLDYVPQRIDVAPSGTAVFVLGGRSVDNTRQGSAIQGSAFVAIYDPKTLAERVRVPLSGLSLGWPDQPPGTLQPGVAIAPDGSRYFVVHADRPLLDVVDTRAPGLERLERAVSLPGTAGAARSAWVSITSDGSRLLTSRRGASLDGDVGVQSIDLKTWRVVTLDSIAQRVGWSVDGRWLFELDPPAAQRPGATRGDRGYFFRNPVGARLSVLDATAAEVAVLARDSSPALLGQFDAGHVFATFVSRRSSDIVAFDARTWQTLAERHVDGPASLVGAPSVW